MGISKYISNQFSKPSGFGGVISTFIMNKINRKQYDSVINNIDIKKGNKILDIGFGNGKFINELSQNSQAGFYGIDISKDMIVAANKKYPNIKFSLANILESPFEDEFFNTIYTINTIYFWGDLEKGMREVYRNLKDDGIFINVIYSKEWLQKIKYTNYGFDRYEVNEVKEMTEKSGLKVMDIVEISKNKAYCIIARK